MVWAGPLTPLYVNCPLNFVKEKVQLRYLNETKYVLFF